MRQQDYLAGAVALATGLCALSTGCEPQEPYYGDDAYYDCWPRDAEKPEVGPVYQCFQVWTDPRTGEPKDRGLDVIAPTGDVAEKCWAKVLGNSQQYKDPMRWCELAGTHPEGGLS